MVIFLAPYHLANSQAFSVSTSCLHSGITKHDTHQERKKNVHPYIPLVEHRRDFTLVTLKKSATSSCSWVFSHVCVVISIFFQVFYRLILVGAYVKDKSKAAFRLWCSAYYV